MALKRLADSLSNQMLVSSVLASALGLAGFAAFYLGWRGAAASLAVGVQLAYLASGGLAGFALLGTGLGLLFIQVSRHLAARERAAIDAVLDESLALLETIRASAWKRSQERSSKRRTGTTKSRVSAERK